MNSITSAKQDSGADLRKFALTVGGGLGVLSLLIFWRRGPVAAVPTALALVLLALGLTCPRVLRGVRDGWMRAATLMGSFMSYVVLTVTFLFVLTPIGCIIRIMRRDPLARSIDPSAKSYWIARAGQKPMPEQYEKMY